MFNVSARLQPMFHAPASAGAPSETVARVAGHLDEPDRLRANLFAVTHDLDDVKRARAQRNRYVLRVNLLARDADGVVSRPSHLPSTQLAVACMQSMLLGRLPQLSETLRLLAPSLCGEFGCGLGMRCRVDAIADVSHLVVPFHALLVDTQRIEGPGLVGPSL